jgi:hypothetical protein
MWNRRRNRLLRRLVLGFAIALVVVPAAQARVDGGTGWSGPGQSETFAPEQGALVQGDNKDGVGTSPGTVVIVGDDKRGLPSASVVPVGHPDNWRGASPSQAAIRIVFPTAVAQYNQYAYRHPLPQDYGPQAAILAELDAKTNEYVAGTAPVVDEPGQVVSSPSDGFDWGDAGIGAGTAFAVVLLGAGALLATRHVGRPAQV